MLVCGSGDIKTWQDAIKRRRETRCDGVMIGRGTLGKPWIFKEIKEQKDFVPKINEIKELTIDLAEKSYAIWGDKGIVEARKHFACYFKGFKGAQGYRKELMTAKSLLDVKKILA